MIRLAGPVDPWLVESVLARWFVALLRTAAAEASPDAVEERDRIELENSFA